MISDEYVKQLFAQVHGLVAQESGKGGAVTLPTQFYRGIGPHMWEGQHPGGCDRHLGMFAEYNVIPRYCFDCYKVLAEPRTVMELFKLMVVFEHLKLPKDNTRKCITEGREGISGTYKGFIYCRTAQEGLAMEALLRRVVSEQITENMPVNLKRGCSEYTQSWPAYAHDGKGPPDMEYNRDWQMIEDMYDEALVIDTRPFESDTYNHAGYNLEDAMVMFSWLTYASTIGDDSYLKITGQPIPPFTGMEPRLFEAPGDE